MGAGFAISMRDLEIRGAGNILGTEQSGHIATVGYELYCSLLEQAAHRLKNLPPKASVDVDIDLPGQGYIPRTYVADMRLKIDLYRRLTRVALLSELNDIRNELNDRFGPPPEPVVHLLAITHLRVLAHQWGIDSIHREDNYVVFTYTSRRSIEMLAAVNRGKLRVVDNRSAYLPLDEDVFEAGMLIDTLKTLLRRE